MPTPVLRITASGLRFPEGPVALKDGGLLFVQIAAGLLSRLRPDGRVTEVARLGGGPNGAAVGPDGAVYIANNGGLRFSESEGVLRVADAPNDYAGGSIQRVDLATGAVTTLYVRATGHRLSAPNDLLFDADGGLWFTDTGKSFARARDHGGLYWARHDGSELREIHYPLLSPNGIALAPDRRTLYVALSDRRQIAAYQSTAAAGCGTKVASQCSASSPALPVICCSTTSQSRRVVRWSSVRCGAVRS